MAETAPLTTYVPKPYDRQRAKRIRKLKAKRDARKKAAGKGDTSSMSY